MLLRLRESQIQRIADAYAKRAAVTPLETCRVGGPLLKCPDPCHKYPKPSYIRQDVEQWLRDVASELAVEANSNGRHHLAGAVRRVRVAILGFPLPCLVDVAVGVGKTWLAATLAMATLNGCICGGGGLSY